MPAMGQRTLVGIFGLVFSHIMGLSPDGCEDGWTAFGSHCYLLGVMEGPVTPAIAACRALGSNLASLWGGDEKDFVLETLWKTRVSRDSFVWYGLYGTENNEWAWRDDSRFKASHLATSVKGTVGDKRTKCGALLAAGNYAFLDCNMDAHAYVCKKALPMLYTTSSLVNYSTPTDQAQLFERVVPPALSGYPSTSFQIAQIQVTSETGCAYYCFALDTCMAFEYTCITGSACSNYTCKLLQGI